MKKVIIIMILTLMTGCSLVKKTNDIRNKESSDGMNSVYISINEKEYILHLENNETVNDFTSLLPISMMMLELNGNEKYGSLDRPLSTSSYDSGTINKGDVMLYGNNTLVIFYKTFNTNYSYSKIGHIYNLDDLDSSNVEVKIYAADK